jgi:hypothetical protein
MRFLFSFLTLFVFSFAFSQQGVGINTDGSNPDASAMLDVKSTTKGLLIPRMTSAERTRIVSPAVGLLVYETTSNAVWTYNGTAWEKLGGGTQWTTSSNNIYNSNSGNVGIGTNNPEEKLHLSGNMRINGTNPIIQFQQSTVNKGFLQLSGNNLRLGTNLGNRNGNFIVRMNGEERLFIDSAGKVGIGTTEPTSKLEVAGGIFLNSSAPKLKFKNGGSIFDFSTVDFLNVADEVKFRLLQAGNNFTLGRPNSFGIESDLKFNTETGNIGINTVPHATDKIYADGSIRLAGGARVLRFETLQGGTGTGQLVSTKYAPGIHFIREGGDILGKMEYVDTADFKNFLRFNTGSTPSNDLTIGSDHNVGIGTNDPLAKLQISGGDEQLRIFRSENPILQFADGFAFNQVKRGFIQLSGDNLRVGTNSENTSGKFIVRTGGDDRLFVDASGMQVSNGGILSIAKNSGLKTVEIKPTENGSDGSSMLLYNSAGIVTIELDADHGGDGDGRVITSELEITGGSDLAENFDINEAEEKNLKPGMLVSIDPEKEGLLCITKQANDKKIVGVVSGANGIKPGMLMGQHGTMAFGKYPVALAGRVYVLCNEEGGEINAGDFLTSASQRGYAKKAGNLLNAQGAIIGKAMGKVNPRTGYVLVLINLQ